MLDLPKYTKGDFEEPLAPFVEIDREGWASFSYACHSGALQGMLRHADELVQSAAQARGKRRDELLRDAANYLAKSTEEIRRVAELWAAHKARHQPLFEQAMDRACGKTSDPSIVVGGPQVEAVKRLAENGA